MCALSDASVKLKARRRNSVAVTSRAPHSPQIRHPARAYTPTSLSPEQEMERVSLIRRLASIPPEPRHPSALETIVEIFPALRASSPHTVPSCPGGHTGLDRRNGRFHRTEAC